MSTFGPYPATVVSVHDGDTCVLSIELGFDISFRGACRCYGINAPELSTPEGKAALAYALTLIKPGDSVTVVSHGYDKFGGRFDGAITLADGRDFGVAMVTSGNAKPYFGSGPKP
jgi:endonuclease YncB( thermonuclease family)